MNREKIKRLSKQFGVGRKVKLCIWWDIRVDMGREDDGTISCAHVGHTIDRNECPSCNGLECPYTAKFIHIIWEDAEAGPNGELILASDVDDETLSIISNEE